MPASARGRFPVLFIHTTISYFRFLLSFVSHLTISVTSPFLAFRGSSSVSVIHPSSSGEDDRGDSARVVAAFLRRTFDGRKGQQERVLDDPVGRDRRDDFSTLLDRQLPHGESHHRAIVVADFH